MKYVFVNGRVAIVVRYWEQAEDRIVAGIVDGGARVDIRRVEQVTGPGHRGGNSGFTVRPVSDGLWRADLFMVINQPGTPCFHYHPQFANNDVGDRHDEELLANDPVTWIGEQLADITGLLKRAGAEELIGSLDLQEHRRALPLMIAAVNACMARLPVALSVGHEPML